MGIRITNPLNKNTRLILPLLLALACWTEAHAAGTLRCQGKIIRTGVPAVYILATCGPPEYQVVQELPARSATINGFSRATGYALSEQWIYNRGEGRFPALLQFHDGTLRRIDFLPHRTQPTAP